MSPDVDAIRAYLTAITNPWRELGAAQHLELRCLAEGSQTNVTLFSTDMLSKAIDHAAAMNEAGLNVYTCVNLINPTMLSPGKAAKDADILQAHFAFADCDTPGSAEALQRNAPPYDFCVITGSQPYLRCHYYWQLVEPVHDLLDWSETQKALAKAYAADEKVCNPSRIMRVAGTIAYPSIKKREKGYVPELTQLTGLKPCQ